MRKLWASSVVVAGLTVLTGAQETAPPAEVLDFAQATYVQERRPPKRAPKVQRMIIDLLAVDVPGARAARAAPLFKPPSAFTFISAAARGIWLYPLKDDEGQATRATRVHAYVVSLGVSQGEAFDIQIVNDGTAPVRLGGDGIVVEPIERGEDRSLRAEMQKVSTRAASSVKARANAYCLEFKLDPPDQGMMFRVVDAATQQQYAPAREILRAARRLQAAGELQPDSEPTGYFHAIRQWAIWVDEQKFTMPRYRDALVDRTKKIAESVGQRVTSQMESLLRAAAPRRYDEIAKILREAKLPVPGQ